MLRPYTANPDLPYVRDFCHLVAQGQTPILIPCHPVLDQPGDNSEHVVPQQVSTQGGEQLKGWVIRETPGLFIEAEPYSIWRDPQGNLLDITTHKLPYDNVLFVPDEKRVYRGLLIDTVRRPLVDDVDVIRFLHVMEKHATLSHKLDQAEEQGILNKAARIERDLWKVQKEMAQIYTRLERRS